ncbi:MAG: extracellular solute-binding protein, partial [Armatimonadota bacterium]|nr:extracellular solute-binding protein [Armatimonadota bacterium]
MKYVFLGAALVWGALSVVAWAIQPRRPDDGKIPIVWATDDNPARQEQMAIFERMFPQYDISIDPANYNRAKIIVQTIGGIGPDVFDFGGPAALRSYVEAGIIWDITDKVQEYGIDYRQCWPAAWSSMVLNGRQYAFPCNAFGNALFYHRDLFRQAGVPEPQGDWTWDEFLAVCKRLMRYSPDGKRVVQFAVLNLDWREMIYQNGGCFFTPDGRRCVVDSPEAIEAVQFYYDLMADDRHHVMPSPADLAAMSNEGGWGTGGI